MRKKRLTVYVTDAGYEKIVDEAKKQGLSVSTLVLIAITNYITK